MTFARPRFAVPTKTKTNGTGPGEENPSGTGLYAEPLMADDGTLMLAENNDVTMGLANYINPLNLGGDSTPPTYGS